MKKIKDLIDDMTRQRPLKRNHYEQKVFSCFVSILKNDQKKYFDNLGYKNGTLTLGVSSSSLYQEAVQFHKENWLKKMQALGSSVKRIQIKITDFSGEECGN
jgi:hypothetical protein